MLVVDMAPILSHLSVPVGHAGGVTAPEEVFNEIFVVFLILGTLVGVVVVAYTLYNAVKYRDGTGNGTGTDVERPQMGELPSGAGGGRKLAISFTLSAVIVVGLILWTYVALLYIEEAPSSQDAQQQALDNNAVPAEAGQIDPIDIEVIGYQFSWEFVYPNGHSEIGELQVPKNRLIRLNVTSADVFHNIGVSELRWKADAVPGQRTSAWFIGKEINSYEAQCYELCGVGHSAMTAEVHVVTQNDYDEWYNETGEDT